eukprot:scaffold4026_cov117-Cylindrotheca_fusiformis.AAC.10
MQGSDASPDAAATGDSSSNGPMMVQALDGGDDPARRAYNDEFYLRYYVGHKGEYGHEFMVGHYLAGISFNVHDELLIGSLRVFHSYPLGIRTDTEWQTALCKQFKL